MGTENHKHPMLTIGMIFRNDKRSLGRCMEALQPLREAVPCELIMADTGSDDGSREIAAGYADVLFDFPWMDDFSAARNAVMDRASGRWFLTLDSDEYLDSDISELVEFFRLDSIGKLPKGTDACTVVQRNYDTLEMNGIYADFSAIRMLRMATGIRYQGLIHESWLLTSVQYSRMYLLTRTILHHDGYADSSREQGKKKKQRNIRLLQKELDRNPEDLLTKLRYIESTRGERGHLELIRDALKAVEEKCRGWELLGGTIYRHAVRAAVELDLPEYGEWVRKAEEQFPDSFFTQIDVQYIAMSCDWERKDYASCIRRGETCLKALNIYRAGKGKQQELLYSTLLMSAPHWEQELKIFLANSYLRTGKPGQCRKLLESLDISLLGSKQTENFLRVVGELHAMSEEDTDKIILNFWKVSSDMKRSGSGNSDLKVTNLGSFYRMALWMFSPEFLEDILEREVESSEVHRPAYTLFLPLENECEPGRGAAALETEDSSRLRQILSQVEDWELFPIQAFSHALLCGTPFPLSENPLRLEEIDSLAGRFAKEKKEDFYSVLSHVVEEELPEDLQKLTWLRGLALAAVQTFDWAASETEAETVSLNGNDSSDRNGQNGKELKDYGMGVARFFARVEGEFLPRYYASGLLCEESLAVLPALHRFGWYCARAFLALDTGDTAGYVHSLREGLVSCPGMKAMVEYMLKHTPELQERTDAPVISPELASLAEQVRQMLAAYPPDAPEVKALKASPAYQKVAWLVEDRSGNVF